MRFWPLIKLIPIKTNFEFVRFAAFAAVLSVIAVAASIFLTLYPLQPPCGGLACGIDFKGGNELEISTAPTPIDLGKIRQTTAGLNMGDVNVQGFGAQAGQEPTQAMIRFQTPEGETTQQAVGRVTSALTEALGPQTAFRPAAEVGSKVSGELLVKGVSALAVAIFLMLIYIWFRFEWQFALGAVAALMHDTILVFGLFAICGKVFPAGSPWHLEFSLNAVAAVLTVIGYSMNDTVVVFDRLRENLRKYKKMPLRDVINLSINETLSRTIITAMTALLALIVLAVFGGSTLFTFSIAMIFGIVIGTYSSIYVAAPVIMLWGVKRGEEEAVPLKPQVR